MMFKISGHGRAMELSVEKCAMTRRPVISTYQVGSFDFKGKGSFIFHLQEIEIVIEQSPEMKIYMTLSFIVL